MHPKLAEAIARANESLNTGAPRCRELAGRPAGNKPYMRHDNTMASLARATEELLKHCPRLDPPARKSERRLK